MSNRGSGTKIWNLEFSSLDGVLRTDHDPVVFPGQSRAEFELGFGFQFHAVQSAPGFVHYGPMPVLLWGQSFMAGFSFFHDCIHAVTLSRRARKLAKLGYDATENDLLAERTTLTQILSKGN